MTSVAVVAHRDKRLGGELPDLRRTLLLRLDRASPYELDGGARTKTRKLRVRVEPAAVCVCVPDETVSDDAPIGSKFSREEQPCQPRR
jgi:hypothetical protein